MKVPPLKKKHRDLTQLDPHSLTAALYHREILAAPGAGQAPELDHQLEQANQGAAVEQPLAQLGQAANVDATQHKPEEKRHGGIIPLQKG